MIRSETIPVATLETGSARPNRFCFLVRRCLHGFRTGLDFEIECGYVGR